VEIVSRVSGARYSVPAWILAYMSTMTGILAISVVYTNDHEISEIMGPMPFHEWVFGPVLILAGICAMVGMARHKPRLVRVGSFVSFFTWLMGMFAFFQADHTIGNILLLGLPMMFFWACTYTDSYVRN